MTVQGAWFLIFTCALLPLGSYAQNGAGLPAADEKDSYEIYSLLLPLQEPAESHITDLEIASWTQAFLNPNGQSCLSPAPRQKSIYQPVIDDYVSSNKTRYHLERKFDLPHYSLVAGPSKVSPPGPPYMIFHVSAVGFNRDRTRTLVSISHECGGLCGGGAYQFLIKKDGRWKLDRDYHGATCVWMARSYPIEPPSHRRYQLSAFARTTRN